MKRQLIVALATLTLCIATTLPAGAATSPARSARAAQALQHFHQISSTPSTNGGGSQVHPLTVAVWLKSPGDGSVLAANQNHTWAWSWNNGGIFSSYGFRLHVNDQTNSSGSFTDDYTCWSNCDSGTASITHLLDANHRGDYYNWYIEAINWNVFSQTWHFSSF